MATRINRRQMLTRSCVGALSLPVALSTAPLRRSLADDAGPRRFKIGVCDWSLGHARNPQVFPLAQQIGLDGVEVSFGEPGGDYDLREEGVRGEYRKVSEKHGLEIASLAMGVLNQVPYATDARAEQWVADAVDVMPKLGVKRCLLAFFAAGDINGDRGKQAEVIRRLKRIAPQAERAGVTLGIESWLNAEDHLRILDAVDSPAIQVYYDVANMTKQGYDVGREIRQIGRQRICQIHMKENGFLLGQGKVNFQQVKAAIDEIGYDGWLIIEGATVSNTSLADCYRHNQQYLRSLFSAG